MTTVHFVFLLAQDFQLGIFAAKEYAMTAPKGMSYTKHYQ
jgi:hypothetical protein